MTARCYLYSAEIKTRIMAHYFPGDRMGHMTERHALYAPTL